MLITICQYVKLATSLGLKTPQEAYGNAKDKVNLNYILILDPDYLFIISLKTAYLSWPKGKIKIRSELGNMTGLSVSY